MMKFVRSRSRGAYYVSPPQGDALGQEVAESSGKEQPGLITSQYKYHCLVIVIRSLHFGGEWRGNAAQDSSQILQGECQEISEETQEKPEEARRRRRRRR